MAETLRIGVGGAGGRMGLAVCELARATPEVALAARFSRPGVKDDQHPAFSDMTQALRASDVVVDFSTPEATVALARAASAVGGAALVLGATGLSEMQEADVAEAAARLPIVRSGNFSLGINLLAALVRRAAAALPARDWDIEIIEAHHRRKLDAPSGTALMLGEAASDGRGGAERLPPRDGVTGQRPPGPVGYAVVRGGGIVGEHSVIFAAEEEILTLSHSARDRRLFARGALIAALWVHGRPPGLYGMADVLGLETQTPVEPKPPAPRAV